MQTYADLGLNEDEYEDDFGPYDADSEDDLDFADLPAPTFPFTSSTR